MRALVGTVAMLAALGLGASPAYADEDGGRGDDGGEADGPESAGPESSAVDYPSATWLAANKKNYTNGDRPESDPINKVVIHVMQGTIEGTKAWFRNPKSEVSAHYAIESSNGAITQMVHESDIGWHAGNWEVNKTSIGIEHEGYVDEPKKWFTKKMYSSSAKLVRSICDRYDIPIDRDHIIAHSEVPGADHTDPGKGWDWDEYMKLIKDAKDEAITLDNDTAESEDSWRTAEATGQYGENFAYASPVLRSDPLWYSTDLEAGRYRVEVRYPAAPDNNTKTPYLVNTASGFESVYVDQTAGGGEWASIGSFDFDSGQQQPIGVSRWTGGHGRVVADGVRLVKD
ncbi:MAG: N-acetylmuramoyl-L-alanine amidase [Stackebrandtia sp.]